MRINFWILLLIFVLALMLRFFYFPQNVYFGFDQARDAYAVSEILKGDLKIVGPPTANGIIHHGVLYYYIFAPFYFFSGGDPTAVSAFLRVVNAAGIFLVFAVVYPMFGKMAALMAAFLFAISYEQTQFSLFLNHPSLAVISILIFYLGLSTWIFRKKSRGLLLALFGLGLSIQFEFVEVQLIGIFLFFLLAFRKYIPKLNFKSMTLALISFLPPISTYIISEIKNNFMTLRELPNILSNKSPVVNSPDDIPVQLIVISRHIHDSLAAHPLIAAFVGFSLFAILIKLLFRNIYKNQLIFLSIWFFGGFLVYFSTRDDAYFYNSGTSISLLIFSAFLISRVYSKSKVMVFSTLILILISNLYLITKNNPMGPNQKINPQIGLLLKDEQKVLDYIYQNAKGGEFAVNALTMPYNINTTWSYLFEWYGERGYGYLPVWGGDAAEGFPGNLKVETARSKLPSKRFLIIEPLEGIPVYLINNFIAQEENYTNTIEKKNIGTMQVWVQQPK